jgi:hypothetical protein
MLQFQKQQISFADGLRELLALRLEVCRDVDKCHQPEVGFTLLGLDYIGISVYECVRSIRPFDPERSKMIAGACYRFRKRAAIRFAFALQHTPGFAFDIAAGSPSQLLEFCVRIDDAFRTLHRRNDNRNGYLIE